MGGIVRINNTLFEVEDNYTLNFNNFETLDNATINITMKVDVDFDYFDEIIIKDNYFYLIDWSREKINNHNFEYKLQVVNPVIQLQNIFLPNRAVEKGDNLTLLITQFLELYTDKLVMSDKLRFLISNQTVNQETWSQPTLYEVFNELLRPFNAIVTMDDFYTISYIDLGERGEDISDLEILNIIKKSDYSNHATNFKTQLQNTISENIIVETKTFESIDKPILSDDNFNIVLEHPVERLIRVTAIFVYWNALAEQSIEFKDITPFFIDKEVYDRYKVSNELGTVPPTGYKRNHLWYETGGNILGGFDYNDKSWIPIINVNKYSYDYWGSANTDYTSGIKSATIRVEYEAQINDVGLEMKKDALATQDKTIMVNQSDAYVDLDSFAKQQRLNLERSSALTIEIYGEGTPPKLRDYYEDYNIYLLRVEYNKESLSWYAEAKKGFSYHNIRAAVSSEKRFTQIEAPNKAFLSNHVTSYDYEFDDIYKDFEDAFQGVRDVMLFKDGTKRELLYLETKYFSEAPRKFILSPLLEKYGNSLIINYSFKDNYSAGISSEGGGASVAQTETPYVDDEGQMKSLKIKLLNDLYVFDAYGAALDTDTTKEWFELITNIKLLPLVKNETIINYLDTREDNILIDFTDYNRYKRNREITAETLQFNLLSNEKVIIFDEYFKHINWGLGNNDVFNKDNYIVGLNTNENRPYTQFDNSHYDIVVPSHEWYIMDNGFYFNSTTKTYGAVIISKVDNKTLMVYNGNSKALYLNKSYRRPKNNYMGLGYAMAIEMLLGLDLGATIKNAPDKRPLKLGLDLSVEIEASHSKFKNKAYTLDMPMGVDIATNHRNFKYDAYKLDMSMSMGIDLAAIHGKFKYNTYTPEVSMGVEMAVSHSKFEYDVYTLDTLEVSMGVDIDFNYKKQ